MSRVKIPYSAPTPSTPRTYVVRVRYAIGSEADLEIDASSTFAARETAREMLHPADQVLRVTIKPEPLK